MILNFMKSSALDLLKTDISNNVARYSSKDKWIDNYFEEKKFSSYSFSTGIAVPDVELIAGDARTDYENAVNLYEAFRDRINPVQAGDLRLWAFLAHSVYWDYMRERWAIDMVSEDEGNDETVKNKMVSRIGVRYFFGASMAKAFVRHGIARLYWSAHLTYDENSKDNPYELTEYFLSRQDIFAAATERTLARNKEVLLASLKVLKEAGTLKREVIRRCFMRLNQAGGVIMLDSLSREAAYELAESILEKTKEEMIYCN